MEPRQRLSSEERHRLIIEAAVPLFAREGFRGVTTKEIAKQAGVSEGLLYQHFPSKEVLYGEVRDYCCKTPPGLEEAVAALVPSTASLITLLFLFAKMVIEQPLRGFGPDLIPRLILNSVLEDGAFARLHQERTASRMMAMMEKCFFAARANGDLPLDGLPDDVRFWLCHHALVTMNLYQLPSPPVVTYSAKGAAMVGHVMVYMLRGVGLTSAAIARDYDHERLDATVTAWLAGAANG